MSNLFIFPSRNLRAHKAGTPTRLLPTLSLLVTASLVTVWLQGTPGASVLVSQAQAQTQEPPPRFSTDTNAESTDGPALPENAMPDILAATDNQWADIVERAIRFSPDVADAAAQIAIADEELGIANADYLPRITAGASSSYSPDENTNDEAINVTLSQMLYDFGKTDARVDTASGRVSEQKQLFATAVEDTIRDTLTALTTAEAEQNAIRIREEQLEEMESLLSLAKQRARLGATGQGEALEAESNVEAARSDLLASRLALSTALGELENLTGMRLTDVPAGQLPNAPQQACAVDAQNASSNNPRILAAMARFEQARSQVDENRANLLPTINLEPVIGMQPFDGGSFDDRVNTNLTLSVDTELYSGGSSQARVRAGEAGIQAAQSRIDAQQLEIQRTLNDARLSLASLTDSQRSIASRLTALKAVKELYLRQYKELGNRTLTDLSNQYRSFYDSRLTLNDADKRINQNGITCLHAVGELRAIFSPTREAPNENDTDNEADNRNRIMLASDATSSSVEPSEKAGSFASSESTALSESNDMANSSQANQWLPAAQPSASSESMAYPDSRTPRMSIMQEMATVSAAPQTVTPGMLGEPRIDSIASTASTTRTDNGPETPSLLTPDSNNGTNNDTNSDIESNTANAQGSEPRSNRPVGHVHVLALSNATKAEQLRQRLEDSIGGAFKVMSNGGLHRIQTGPLYDQQDIDAILQRLISAGYPAALITQSNGMAESTQQNQSLPAAQPSAFNVPIASPDTRTPLTSVKQELANASAAPQTVTPGMPGEPRIDSIASTASTTRTDNGTETPGLLPHDGNNNDSNSDLESNTANTQGSKPRSNRPAGHVHVLAFSNATKAEQLRQRLEDSIGGTFKVMSNGGLHRVQTGPLYDQQDIEATLQRLISAGYPAALITQ